MRPHSLELLMLLLLLLLPCNTPVAAAATRPCTPLAGLTTDAGVLSPLFSPANCGHSYQLHLSGCAHLDHARSTPQSHGHGGQLLCPPDGLWPARGRWVERIPGVATGTPFATAAGAPLTIPVQLVQNVIQGAQPGIF